MSDTTEAVLIEELKDLQEALDESENELSDANDEIKELQSEVVELESNQSEENTIEFPYLSVNDQLKADALLESWDKFTWTEITAFLSTKE